MFITPQEYRALLDLFMCSDPSPLPASEDDVIGHMLNRLANEAKLDATWIDAYHYYHPDRYGRVWWLSQAELCKECGQPDNCGDCTHERLGADDIAHLGGVFI